MMIGKPSKLGLSNSVIQLQLVVAKDTQPILLNLRESPFTSTEALFTITEKKSLLAFSISLEPELLMPGVLLMLFMLSRVDIAWNCKVPNLETLHLIGLSIKKSLITESNFKKVAASATLITKIRRNGMVSLLPFIIIEINGEPTNVSIIFGWQTYPSENLIYLP